MTVHSDLGTRERLLEAAGEVFAAEGYRGATVRAICQRAEANVAAVNYHFQGKDTLYREALRYAFERAHERFPLPAGEAQGSVAARLERFVTAFLRRLFSANESWHGRLLARELADPTGALEPVVQRYMRPVFEILDRIVADACPQLSAEERRLHAFSLLGQCVFFRHARPVIDRLFGPESYGPERIPELTRHIVTVFLRGLALDPPPKVLDRPHAGGPA